MTADRTLAKVEADLAAGHVALARQRLRGLVASFPDRLDLRDRLAEIYRIEGDLPQAGRWSYLSPDPDPREVAAFERAYRDPFSRMRALHWRHEEDACGADVAARLRALREAAEALAGEPVDWADPRRPEPRPSLRARLAEYGCLVLVVVVLGLALLGIGRLAVAGWGVVTAWLR